MMLFHLSSVYTGVMLTEVHPVHVIITMFSITTILVHPTVGANIKGFNTFGYIFFMYFLFTLM